jgi:hypothetical protein
MAKTVFGPGDDALTYSIIGCAMKVHKTLGPGLGEAIYDDCMAAELKKANIDFKQHPAIRVPYEGKMLDRYYRPGPADSWHQTADNDKGAQRRLCVHLIESLCSVQSCVIRVVKGDSNPLLPLVFDPVIHPRIRQR